MGGGWRGFLPKEIKDGERKDGKNLLDEWKIQKAALNKSYSYVTTRDELLGMSTVPDYLLGQ